MKVICSDRFDDRMLGRDGVQQGRRGRDEAAGQGIRAEQRHRSVGHPGGYQQGRVAVDRKGGFDGPVTIELIGVPAGVTVDGGNMQTLYPKDEALNLKMMAGPTSPRRRPRDHRQGERERRGNSALEAGHIQPEDQG